MKQANSQIQTARYLSYIIAAIFALLPFHAFFTTWLGSTFGHLDTFRIWKELLIVGIMPIALIVALKNVRLRRWLRTSWLPRVVLAYAVLTIAHGVLSFQAGRVNTEALIFSLLINLRFLGFFMIVLVVAATTDFLSRQWQRFILWPAIAVVVIGVAQRFLLPYDFLKHFGYGPDTIPAYQTIDQKLSFRRIQATLRGANPFGAYLVVALPFLWFIKDTARRAAIIALGCTALFFTYSRSAWIGLLVAVSTLLWLKGSRLTKTAVPLAVVLLVVLGGALYLMRDNTLVQNTLFHTDETSQASISSNASRLGQLQVGIEEIYAEPLGRGPGTAGPASFRNDQPARIAENYFVQIGQEVGIVGVALFIIVNVLTIKLLWHRRHVEFAVVLLAIYAGLTAINLVSHAWTDDTLAYIWWGLAGIAAAPAILNKERK